MVSSRLRRRLVALVGFVLAGAALGFGVRLVAAGTAPQPRAAFVLVTALAVSLVGGAVVAGARAPRLEPLVARVLAAAWLTAGVAAGSVAALLASGAAAGALAACAVPPAAALLAWGAAALARSLGARGAGAALWGAAVPALLAASVFVADPWIEWDGPEAASVRRAAIALDVSPIAAITSHRGGVGVDWQRQRLLYDGPGDGAGGGGLSVIGPAYPSDPPSAPGWALAASAAGLLLGAIGGAVGAAGRAARRAGSKRRDDLGGGRIRGTVVGSLLRPPVVSLHCLDGRLRMIKKVFLTFPQRLIREPILYELAQRFDVKTNIRGASVTDEIAVVALQLEGEESVIEDAVAHLRDLGVTAEWLTEN